MHYFTPRKRAEGMGASHGGTHHHQSMTRSSAGLVVLMILFLFTFGRILGAPYEQVVAYYQHPFPAVIAILTLIVGFWHFKEGAKSTIIDYLPPTAAQWTSMVLSGFCYFLAAMGVFALVRIAL